MIGSKSLIRQKRYRPEKQKTEMMWSRKMGALFPESHPNPQVVKLEMEADVPNPANTK